MRVGAVIAAMLVFAACGTPDGREESIVVATSPDETSFESDRPLADTTTPTEESITSTSSSAQPVEDAIRTFNSDAEAIAFLLGDLSRASRGDVWAAWATISGQGDPASTPSVSTSTPVVQLIDNAGAFVPEALSALRHDPWSQQLVLAMGLFGRPEGRPDDRSVWGLGLDASLVNSVMSLSESQEPSFDLDEVTRQILTDSWIANVAAHVASGEPGLRAWFEPPTTIEIRSNFIEFEFGHEGEIVVVRADGGEDRRKAIATLAGGLWTLDVLPPVATTSEPIEFEFSGDESTDTTVVEAPTGGLEDPLEVESTDTTVDPRTPEPEEDPYEAPRELSVGELRAPPGTRVGVALGSSERQWAPWQGRTVPATGLIELGIPPQGLALLVTTPDGHTGVWELSPNGQLTKSSN